MVLVVSMIPVMYSDITGQFWDIIIDVASIFWSLYDFYKNPTWGNAGRLALDVIFAIVPFLTGSRLIKSASKYDDISDIAGYVSKYDDTYNAFAIGNNMGRVTSMAMDSGANVYRGFDSLNYLNSIKKINLATDSMHSLAKIENTRWIIDNVSAGRKLINVGSDGRGIFNVLRSAYGTELKVIYRLKHGNRIHKTWWGFNSARRIIW